MKSSLLFSSVLPALLLAAAPGHAAARPERAPPMAMVAPDPLSSPDVDHFMAQRGGSPIWFRNGGGSDAVSSLVTVLRRAPLDGLASGPALAESVQNAARDAASGKADAVARADRIMSAAWLTYVAAIQAPIPGFTYSDPSLAPRPFNPSRVLLQIAAASSPARAVDKIASVNVIYSQIRDAGWAAMQRSGATTPDSRLLANLTRARGFPTYGKYLIVNAAIQRLIMVENNQIVDSMKTIVGRPDSQTPMLASTIWYATVNPYWYVPTDLTRKIVAVRMLKDSNYLNFKHYKIISDFGPTPTIVSPTTIDWKSVASGKTTVFLRQEPGEDNSMGRIKFPFPNDIGVYLHDTDLHVLFAKDPRFLSNGCIRLEDAVRVGRWLMGRDVTTDSPAPEQHIALPRGVPVYLTYLTAKVDAAGQIAYAPDTYGRDGIGPQGAVVKKVAAN